jgi:hypothetical protein
MTSGAPQDLGNPRVTTARTARGVADDLVTTRIGELVGELPPQFRATARARLGALVTAILAAARAPEGSS